MIQVISLLVLDFAFVGHLFFSARHLPERMASHFQSSGKADGWISRRSYLTIIVFLGPGLSLLSVAAVFALRNTPVRLVGQHLAWAGCLILAFIFGIHWITVQANRREPPELPMKVFWGLFASLQIGLLLWVCLWPK